MPNRTTKELLKDAAYVKKEHQFLLDEASSIEKSYAKLIADLAAKLRESADTLDAINKELTRVEVIYKDAACTYEDQHTAGFLAGQENLRKHIAEEMPLPAPPKKEQDDAN